MTALPEPDDDVEVLVGTRQVTGRVDRVETEPTLRGLEPKIHVEINGQTIAFSPGQLRPA